MGSRSHRCGCECEAETGLTARLSRERTEWREDRRHAKDMLRVHLHQPMPIPQDTDTDVEPEGEEALAQPESEGATVASADTGLV
jgi:hypothetical protein